MWYRLRLSSKVDPDFASAADELLLSTSRSLMLIMGTIYFAGHIISAMSWPGTVAGRLWLVALILIPTWALTFWLLSRHFLAAHAVWQLGLAAAIALAVRVFEQPVVGFAYTLLPLMAVVTVGWKAGLLAEVLVIGLVWWLSHSSPVPILSAAHVHAIALGGASTALLGWVSTQSLLTAVQWSLFSYEQARQKMEEARYHRMELTQAQEDLIQANQELARLSDRLKAMYQVAEQARRAKEEFVANVSHELRTPLNMIIGFSEMITHSPQVYGDNLPASLLADIDAIRRNSQHLARLVDDVLDLSQVDAGRMALSKERACLQEIVGEAASAVRALFESKGLYLETEIPSDLPQVFCDSTRVRQVVINLLSNAGRFTEQGGVNVHAWREKNDIVVSVADTGPGIAPEDQERVFEPFQQIDSSIRRRHDGSGLGLSISKQFVEMHGGKMWLCSEPGMGTIITFSLPLETPLRSAFVNSDVMRWFHPYHRHPVRTRRSKAPALEVLPRFVVLEDGDALERLFSRYMDDVETCIVRDAEEAVRELSRSPAQALVVNAPSLDEVLGGEDKLLDLPYATPAVTCWMPGRDDVARRLRVARYLVKPVTREALLSALADLGDVRSLLLVDDEPEALQLFARMLSSTQHDYRILQATNGQWALSLLRERRPDVMLLDLIMPGMDGFQVLREKRKDPSIRDTPVIIVSAQDPTGEPIVSDTLTVRRGGGLSVRDVMACIQAISGILAPATQPDGRERPERPAS